jgi:hypothetical protein
MNKSSLCKYFLFSHKPCQSGFGLLLAWFLMFMAPSRGMAAVDAGTSDTVVFRNGDRLSGHLKMATSTSVNFSGLVTGDVSLNWKDIKELVLTSSTVSIVNSQNPGGIAVIAPDIVVTDTDLCVRAKTQSVQTFPISELVSATASAPLNAQQTPSQPSQGKPYFKAIGGALKLSPNSLIRATQKQTQLAGVFDLGLVTNSEEAIKHQATNIALEANYSDSRKPGGSAVINELYSGTVQQNFYLTDVKHSCEHCMDVAKDGPYVYGITNFYHNLSLGMRLEQAYGAGIGWDGDHGNSSYSLLADLRYVGEDLYAPGTSQSLAVVGLGEQYSYTFQWREGVTLSQRVLLLPALNNSHALQVRGTAGIDVPISSSFAFDVDLLDDYLRNAPPKNLQNFAKITFSLKYAIGAPPKAH